MNPKQNLRYQNPFREATSTELIDNPDTYAQMFSHEILVNETLDLFERNNVILTGPQGTGKTMLLSLFRHAFLSACLAGKESAESLRNVAPFCGISINLVRSSFHIFGRRSVSSTRKGDKDDELDATCAADYINHFLFRQFLLYIEYLSGSKGEMLRKWMGIDGRTLNSFALAHRIAKWRCWRGFYKPPESIGGLVEQCERRLNIWIDFLNANTDAVPEDVFDTKTPLEESLHLMGELISSLSVRKKGIPLFVIIDQYEVLPELNLRYGATLQRLINTLVKLRDPNVFYKVGVRPYDWGRELRIWGSESRIEEDRDYKVVDLTNVLVKKENERGWLFPKFAEDVAYRRLRSLDAMGPLPRGHVKRMFGGWTVAREAAIYGTRRKNADRLMTRGLPEKIQEAIIAAAKPEGSLLETRLAAAWAMQQIQRGVAVEIIMNGFKEEPVPWERDWWRKERIEIALLQMSSMMNQRRKYFGWETVLYLSGSDIRAFLRICEEIWETAAKIEPGWLIANPPIPADIQTEGIFEASTHWRRRDRMETHGGGSRRYEIISRLGPAIHDALIEDLAISNPGHTGFSVREADLRRTPNGRKVADFLGSGLNWAIFEERAHTSKEREGATRAKWFLHPILSPAFGIPVKRVKEPYYTTVEQLYSWMFDGVKIDFRGARRRSKKSKEREDSSQLRLQLGDEE